ncbi:uncharacterized protein [Henckelia pumila]|uniref:uncharacterized protein n=1 Tax=Henckelia pumila TaxID=405737 RepID=UPI003C6DE1E9
MKSLKWKEEETDERSGGEDGFEERESDKARSWLQSLPLGSITTWEGMVVKFLEKLFPPSKATQLKIEINWEEIEFFYNGLNTPTRMSVDSAAGVKKAVYSVDPLTSITAQLSALSTQVASLNKLNIAEPAGEGKASLEDVVSTFVTESNKRMSRTETRMDIMETHMCSLGAMMKSMETHIGQLAHALKDQNRGQFPSNTDVNPKEQCKAVELRSGKKLEADEQRKTKEVEAPVVEEIVVEEPKKETEAKPMYKPQLPYPQRFEKKALDEQFSKFLDMFKKIHINIPFADALEQIPNYAKFIKDVMSKKRRLQENEVMNLTEECNAILQKKTLELGEVRATTITL